MSTFSHSLKNSIRWSSSFLSPGRKQKGMRQIEFACSDRVDSDPALRNEFIEHILGFGPTDPVFISDQSSISDFGDDDEIANIRAKIFERYGVSIEGPEPIYLSDVFELIRSQRDA